MAEVLTPQGDGRQSPFFQSSTTTTNRKKLSPSSSSLYLGTSPPRSSSPRSSGIFTLSTDHAQHTEKLPSDSSSPETTSSLSSRPSTSDFSQLASSVSTTFSGISLEDKYGQESDFEDDYPRFEGFTNPFEQSASEASDEPAESATTDTTASDSPLPTPTVADDTAIRTEPSQHVDYLSHDWREEDVWSSWRHIVSQRRVYGQQSRLENAAWRTWVKSKYHLPTISPETLNWLKESDVTWLYGPLKPASKHPITQHLSAPESTLSKNNSFVNKKPILKKRSMSEVMLQRSISCSSLLKQAAASVQAQGRQKRSPVIERPSSDFVSSGYATTEAPSRDHIESLTATGSSGTRTPSCDGKEKKHIRFDDTVEQCIAVEVKPGEFDDDESDQEQHNNDSSSESEDEGLVMRKMKRRPKLKRSGTAGSGRSSSYNGRKTIETLPSTTLKYRTDSPDVSELQQLKPTLARTWSTGRLSPSASQETLRPSHPSRNFLLGNDEEEEDKDDGGDAGWSFGSSNPKSSLGASIGSSSSVPFGKRGGYTIERDSFDEAEDQREAYHRENASEDYTGMSGMRRTESGMLMPYEEDEDDLVAQGLFGQISDTLNTAKDIAHVIWNVGWRK